MEAEHQNPSMLEGLRQVRLADEADMMPQRLRMSHADLGLLGEEAAMVSQKSESQTPSASRGRRLRACPLQGLLEPSRSDNALCHTDERQEVFTHRPR